MTIQQQTPRQGSGDFYEDSYTDADGDHPAGMEKAVVLTPDQLREEAAKADQAAEDSWNRSDTDGFMTQWAMASSARRLRLEAQIQELDGKWDFPALFDLQGNFVPARLFDGKFGLSWMLLDAEGRATGQFVSAFPARPSTMAKKGFTEGRILRPARAAFVGDLAGSVYAKATVPAHFAPAPQDILQKSDACDGCDHYIHDHGQDGCEKRCPCRVSWSEVVFG